MSHQRSKNGQPDSGGEKAWEIAKKVFSVSWQVAVWCFLAAFWTLAIVIFIIQLIVSIVEGRPMPKLHSPHRRRRVDPGAVKNQIRRERAEKFLDDNESVLLQLQQENLERLQKEQVEEQEKQNRLASLSMRDRILLKMKENPGALLEDIFTEDEMEELALMLLEALMDN